MFSISTFVIGISKQNFICWVSKVASSSWRCCKCLDYKDWKWCLKWFSKMISISPGFSVSIPSKFLSCMTHVLAFLCLTTVWKNLVFLCPWITQALLAFWAHISCSRSSRSFKFSLISFSLRISSRHWIAFWMDCKSCCWCQISYSTFTKTWLFQVVKPFLTSVNLFFKQKPLEPKLNVFQTCWTTFCK